MHIWIIFFFSEWYTDQRLLSIRVARWMMGRDYSTIVLRRRQIWNDRLDRSAWRIERLEQKVDSHLLHNAFGSKWTKLEPLLIYMYLYKTYSIVHKTCKGYHLN